MDEFSEFQPIPAFLARAKWPKVVAVARDLGPERLALHAALRTALTERDIDYRLVQAKGPGQNGVAPPDWAEAVECRPPALGLRTPWRAGLPHLRDADLVIVGDDEATLLGALLPTRASPDGKEQIAVFGERSASETGLRGQFRERLRGLRPQRVQWWFVNGEAAARRLEARGLAADRIVRYQDGVDVARALRDLGAIRSADVEEAKRGRGMNSNNVGLFAGALAPDRRLGFAVEAAERVRTRVPDFHLVILGRGAEERLAQAAHRRRFLHYLGARSGMAKALCARMAKVLVMPGQVGSAMLDGFAYGLPLVATSAATEGGDLPYLVPDGNAVLVEDASDVDAYARAIADLLLDEPRRLRLAEAGRDTVARFTLEAMAGSLADGIARALGRS